VVTGSVNAGKCAAQLKDIVMLVTSPELLEDKGHVAEAIITLELTVCVPRE